MIECDNKVELNLCKLIINQDKIIRRSKKQRCLSFELINQTVIQTLQDNNIYNSVKSYCSHYTH